MLETTENIIFIIRNIPAGKVLSYGKIAALAGMPNGARQVVRILHSMSGKENLPWFRVVNKEGRISLKDPVDAEKQRELLEKEGVLFINNCTVDQKCFWKIQSISEIRNCKLIEVGF